MDAMYSFVWNAELGQQLLVGFVFLVLGVLAAIVIVPWILRRLQGRRDQELTISLLRTWGLDCVGAIMRLKPPGPPIEIEGFGHALPGGGYASDLPIFLFWHAIKDGERSPEKAADVIYQAFQKVLFTDEERATKELPPDPSYSFYGGNSEVPRAMIMRICNPMYAKLEIFELEKLPIEELEMARSLLEGFDRNGHATRFGYSSYMLHLAQAMEKFGEYLWHLQRWPRKRSGIVHRVRGFLRRLWAWIKDARGLP